MNVEFSGKNFDVSDRIRSHVMERIEKLDKRLDDIMDVRVVLAVEKFRHIAELHVRSRHHDLHATEETQDMMSAVNMALDDLEKQARRSRKKFLDKKRDAARNQAAVDEWQVDVLSAKSLRTGGDADQSDAPRIIKSSTLPIKPMSVEEAAMQLDRSRSEFIVFRDSSSNRINVLYKRKDDNYGLIAPEL